MNQQKTVLVVEDEAIVRSDIAEHLAARGYAVLEAANAAEAFDVLEDQSSVDFILTDIDMPGIVDGLTLAKFAAERWPNLRMVVISGQRQAQATDLPDGATFLSKPHDLDAILGALEDRDEHTPAL